MQRYCTQQALEIILNGADPCESDGEDINLQVDSDSELSQLSSDEESAPQPTKRARLATDVTETAKDGTVWHEEQVGTGPHFTLPSPYSADGEPTAKAEVPSLPDCWSKNLGSPHIIETMSRGRFQNIMHHLRFDDRDPRSERVQTDSWNSTILGTVNGIRQEIPPSTRQMHRDEFTTQVFSSTGATLTAYAPKRKKTVYVLSSMHSTIETQKTTKKNSNTITLYNTTKCGVDIMDQMVREYIVRAGTRRWPVAVFYNMIDIAALNAHVLYQLCTGRKERRVDFLFELARELAHSHVDMKKAQKEQLLRQQPSTPQLGQRAKCQAKIKCKGNRATVRCDDCYKYTCGKCRKEQWQCQNC
ncbi:unnamed protein product [Menidia menidia]|uniref:(Atlantic silverside) hypothetical protein n=1 Tax=Menidia menidia TaxID=238744 RepID=A0A8S4C1Y6_9TELE|nr:unnamed protein product [Menidia menidia]